MNGSSSHTFLSLLRKYDGRITDATEEELREASSASPMKGESVLAALFRSVRVFKIEAERDEKRYCFNRGGLCEPDHCRCR